MKQFTIAFDLDDVLCNFIKEFVRMSNAKMGRPPLDIIPVDWEWSNCGWSKEEIADLWKDIANTENFWMTLEPMPGINWRALLYLEKRHNLVFPTARALSKGYPVGLQSADWLSKQFGLCYPAVFVSSSKGELAKVLKYDYFIDDRPKNVIDVKLAVPTCKVFLQDSGHNQAFQEKTYGIVRVKHVNDFMNIIEKEESSE